MAHRERIFFAYVKLKMKKELRKIISRNRNDLWKYPNVNPSKFNFPHSFDWSFKSRFSIIYRIFRDDSIWDEYLFCWYDLTKRNKNSLRRRWRVRFWCFSLSASILLSGRSLWLRYNAKSNMTHCIRIAFKWADSFVTWFRT